MAAVTVVLNNEKIPDNPEKMSKIKSFIKKNKWKGINVPSGVKEWERKTPKKQIELFPQFTVSHEN